MKIVFTGMAETEPGKRYLKWACRNLARRAHMKLDVFYNNEVAMPFTTSWVKALTTGFVFIGAGVALSSPVQSHLAQSTHDHNVVELAQSGGIFSDEERRIIRDVLDVATGQTDDKSDRDGNKKNKAKNSQDNKGKGNKGLPPGIAMKLERGGTLPPGIAKRDLPADLISRLPARTDGAMRQIVGDDVVLIEKGTEVILDVIRDVAGN